MSIWDKIKNAMQQKKIDKVMSAGITNTIGPVKSSNAPTKMPIGNISVQNAQSWLPELHPNGIENSSYIQDIDYANGKMDVTFRDGTTVELDNVDAKKARDFSQAPSKGRFYNQNFRDLPYKII